MESGYELDTFPLFREGLRKKRSEQPETRVTLYTGHIGYSSRHREDYYALEGVFGNG